MVITMNAEKLLVETAKQRWKAEIERAVAKVKLGMIPAKPRSQLDEWFRRRYYIEAARMSRYAERKQSKGKKRSRPREPWKQRNKPSSFNMEKNSRGDI